MTDSEKFKRFSLVLGYNFQEIGRLREAMTHRSKSVFNNERLEFLGDSLLNFSIASELYQRFPKAKEGELTRMRALLVREESLASIARDLNLGDYLQLGIGEQKSGGHTRESILADALEAIIAAIYLDSDLKTCQARISAWFSPRFDSLLSSGMPEKDPKTRLQEYCQAHQLPLPSYEVVAVEGDPHEPLFRVECKVSIPTLTHPVMVAIAHSRRKAEQKAAEDILNLLSREKS